MHCFFDEDVLKKLKQEELENNNEVTVVPEYQGKGYGIKIMEGTFNLALLRNFDIFSRLNCFNSCSRDFTIYFVEILNF